MNCFLIISSIKTLSGLSKSFMADPSAKNSGLERTENVLSSLSHERINISLINSAVLTGTVLFSTTIVCPWQIQKQFWHLPLPISSRLHNRHQVLRFCWSIY